MFQMRKKKEFHKKTEVISPKGRECPRGEKRRRPKQKKKGKKTKKKTKNKKTFLADCVASKRAGGVSDRRFCALAEDFQS